MTDADPSSYLARLPKVELHVHLEGSLRPHTRARLAERHGIATPPAQDGVAFADFDGFIQGFMAGLALLRDQQDLVLAIEALGADLAADAVRYAEVTTTAWVWLADKAMAAEAYAEALAEGRRRVARDHGVELAWVLDIPRGFEAPELQLTAGLLDSPACPEATVAIGLGGPEIGFPPAWYAASFDRARAAGFGALPHGGETGGAGYVRECVELLRPQRIGHGVMAVTDPGVLQLLVERAITLEVCPTSNVLLGVAADLAHHPLGRLRDAGVAVTLATDDPGYFANTVTDELLAAHRHHGFSLADLHAMQGHGVRCSFAGEATRARLLAELDEHRPA